MAQYNASTFIPGDSTPSDIRLKCGNLRIAFLAFSLLCWVFVLVFLCEMAAHCAIPRLSAAGRAINDFFGNSSAFMTGPAIVMGTLLYFIWSRKKLTWNNGLLIDDKPVTVEYYQIKKISLGINLIYLQSARHLWIVYPVTSQDNRKFKDVERMQKETIYNETQVQLLEEKLAASGAAEKRFWLLSRNLVACIFILIAVIVIALSGV